jgi:hypothetical protein
MMIAGENDALAVFVGQMFEGVLPADSESSESSEFLKTTERGRDASPTLNG